MFKYFKDQKRFREYTIKEMGYIKSQNNEMIKRFDAFLETILEEKIGDIENTNKKKEPSQLPVRFENKVIIRAMSGCGELRPEEIFSRVNRYYSLLSPSMTLSSLRNRLYYLKKRGVIRFGMGKNTFVVLKK